MKALNHYGYYVFLGLGDFNPHSPMAGPMSAPRPLTSAWTSTWDLPAWKERIEHFLRLGTNTLFIYLMGDRLPYKSEAFPECLEEDHPNVKNDFFQDVINLALEAKIELVAVFSTTGHAKGYASAHPELATRDRAGVQQVSSGILCHQKEEARQYPLQVIQECLTRYHGFSRVILHPPEFLAPCFCPVCQGEYQRLYGEDLLSAFDEDARRFFMETNLTFQKTVLEPKVSQHLPDVQLLTFTVPWVFEPHFEAIARQIAPKTIIVDWDYDLSQDRIRLLPDRLKRYGQFGHTVWFMPTSGFLFGEDRGEEETGRRVRSQIQLALEAGVNDIIFFMGPVWWPAVETTSWHRQNA